MEIGGIRRLLPLPPRFLYDFDSGPGIRGATLDGFSGSGPELPGMLRQLSGEMQTPSSSTSSANLATLSTSAFSASRPSRR